MSKTKTKVSVTGRICLVASCLWAITALICSVLAIITHFSFYIAMTGMCLSLAVLYCCLYKRQKDAIKDTIKYYNEHASEYIAETQNIDITKLRPDS